MIETPAIVLVPIGTVHAHLLDNLVAPLGVTFGHPCRVSASIAIPETAHDKRRGQYLGRAILSALGRLDLPDAERVLGIIDADCYAPGLNFVFGQASAGVAARDAFIALPRLRQSFHGLPEDGTLFQERALKEAVHELGHTYGLAHCHDPKCVMFFSNSLYDTDVKRVDFCPRCRARL